jgi:hypothetical protein
LLAVLVKQLMDRAGNTAEQHGKRTHLATLHRLLASHAPTIMATPRPIPRIGGASLCPADAPTSCRGAVTAFVFGSGASMLTILENKAGTPATPVAAPAPVAVAVAAPPVAASAMCNVTSFPVDTAAKRYKGLVAAPDSVTSVEACIAACCADTGGATPCTLWQFYGAGSAHKPPLCWLGHNPPRYEGHGTHAR